jgi:hypothetical protein
VTSTIRSDYLADVVNIGEPRSSARVDGRKGVLRIGAAAERRKSDDGCECYSQC